MRRDKLHFRWNKQLGYKKTWNFAIGQRESGKTVDSWFLIWNAFWFKHRPSIVLRRRIADITDAYINDIQNVLNKFLEKPIQLVYLKGGLKDGIVDVRLGVYGQEYSPAASKKLPIFFRVIALSNPMNRIKSLMLPNVRYIFIDEFICNLRGNEKYLKADEFFLVKEIYTTYNREAESPITILAAGNPYSVYCPFFVGLGVNTAQVKPGAFLVGPDYTINCYKVPVELQEQILAANPMYQFDDAYKRYGFGGEAINDANIRIQKVEPKGFKMKYIFKFGNEFVSIHKGTGENADGPFKFWCCKHKADWMEKIGNRREVIVFNFQDLVNGTRKLMPIDGMRLHEVHEAMDLRLITYNCIEAQYMLEDIYPLI